MLVSDDTTSLEFKTDGVVLGFPMPPTAGRASRSHFKAASPPGHPRRWIALGILPKRLAGDAGFTLVEVLVASIAALAVLTAVFAILESSQSVQSRDTEWALTLQEDRTGLARMMRDIRQASKVEEAKAGAIAFLATIGGKSWKIKYECGVSQPGTAYKQCVRLAAEEGKALPGTGPPIARDVLNGTEVFSYSPSAAAPTAATARIELPAKGTLTLPGSAGGYTHRAVLEDAAFMRNLYLQG